MKKYKLIKEYPNSIALNSVVEYDKDRLQKLVKQRIK